MNKKYKGIIYIVLAALCFSFMNMFVRMAGPNIPSMQKSFFRNLVAMFFSAAVILKNHDGFMWEKGNFTRILGRSFFGTVGLVCNFYAVDHLVMSDASLLNKMSPFFVIILSLIFLKERVKLYQALCVALAFIGSLFVIKPSFQNADLMASLVGLLGGFCAGAAYTFVRALSKRGEKKSRIVFCFSFFSCLMLLPGFIMNYVPMSGREWMMLLLAGLSATGGQFAITAAYANAPSKEISIYDYSQIIFSALLGWVAFGQVPDHLSILGYVVILTAAAVMFYLNNYDVFHHHKKSMKASS